jgi:hypothetical protein
MFTMCATVLLTIGQTDDAIVATQKLKVMEPLIGAWESPLDGGTKGIWKLEPVMNGLYIAESFTVVSANDEQKELLRSMICWEKEKKQIRASNFWEWGVSNQVCSMIDKNRWVLNFTDGNLQAVITFKDPDTMEAVGADGKPITSTRVSQRPITCDVFNFGELAV